VQGSEDPVPTSSRFHCRKKLVRSSREQGSPVGAPGRDRSHSEKRREAQRACWNGEGFRHPCRSRTSESDDPSDPSPGLATIAAGSKAWSSKYQVCSYPRARLRRPVCPTATYFNRDLTRFSREQFEQQELLPLHVCSHSRKKREYWVTFTGQGSPVSGVWNDYFHRGIRQVGALTDQSGDI